MREELLCLFPRLTSKQTLSNAVEIACKDGAITLTTLNAIASLEKTINDIRLQRLHEKERLLRLELLKTELEINKAKLAKVNYPPLKL